MVCSLSWGILTQESRTSRLPSLILETHASSCELPRHCCSVLDVFLYQFHLYLPCPCSATTQRNIGYYSSSDLVDRIISNGAHPVIASWPIEWRVEVIYPLSVSYPNLFHLSSLLSPPPPGVACFPQCIYPCVSCLSVPVRLVCFQVNRRFFPFSCLCYSPFSSPPGFDPCLFWTL